MTVTLNITKPKSHRATSKVCPCGQPGVKWNGACWGCNDCLAIEARFPTEHAGRGPKPKNLQPS